MTAVGVSPEFGPSFIDDVEPIDDLPAAAEQLRAVTFPGRWVGGAVGVIATILVGVPLAIAGALFGESLLLSAAAVCALGIPIAFILGRHLLPIAVAGSKESPVAAVLTFAFLAPVLGDVEIVGAGVLLASDPIGGTGSAIASGVIIGAIGAVLCFVAAPVTLAVGIVWFVLLRLIPETRIAALRAPAALERFGVRHASLAILLLAIAARLAGLIGSPSMSGW